jgi:hypothetical protein
MPVKYIDVKAVSDMFVPATRAFGDIAIIGKGAANTAASAPKAFSNPADALTAYPPANVTDPPTDLSAAIVMAFKQTPPPTTVWGVQVAATNPDWDAALAAVAKLDVQLVALANTLLNATNATVLDKLGLHVTTVSNTGGDGRERIGVIAYDPAVSVTDALTLRAGNIKNERVFLLHHKSTEDAAAAAAGVIAGYEPHISMLLKPISVNQAAVFSDTEIDQLSGGSINWVTSPSLIPGGAMFLGEGYTADPSKKKKYIDIVRCIDDVNFRIKAELIQAIGNFRVSRTGLRGVVTIVQSVLEPLVGRQVIEDYTVYIPLLMLFDKDPATLTAAELAAIQKAQADRAVDMVVTVDYAGAIHRLRIDLVFK